MAFSKVQFHDTRATLNAAPGAGWHFACAVTPAGSPLSLPVPRRDMRLRAAAVSGALMLQSNHDFRAAIT